MAKDIEEEIMARKIAYAHAKKLGWEFYNLDRKLRCGHKSKSFTRSKKCYQCWLEKTGVVEEHFEPKEKPKEKVTNDEREDLGIIGNYIR